MLSRDNNVSRVILHLVLTGDIICVIFEGNGKLYEKKEMVAMQDEFIDAMINNLPVLRASTGMTQAQLAGKVGVSRQTIVAIETRKRSMPWTLYLALVCVFQQYEESKKLLETFDLFETEFFKGNV